MVLKTKLKITKEKNMKPNRFASKINIIKEQAKTQNQTQIL